MLRVTYVGLLVNARLGTLGLTAEKRSKLLALLEPVRLGDRLDKRAVQKIGGSLLWAAVAVPEAKPWLADIYVAVSKPGQLWIQAQASCA